MLVKSSLWKVFAVAFRLYQELLKLIFEVKKIKIVLGNPSHPVFHDILCFIIFEDETLVKKNTRVLSPYQP